MRWQLPECSNLQNHNYVSFKNVSPYGVSSVTIVWRRQKHQYPRKQQYHQLLFFSESRFNLKANAKRKSIHPIKAKPLLPAFPKLIHQHLHIHPTEFNHAVHDEPSRLLEYLWDLCSQHHECNVLMDEVIQCFLHSSDCCSIMIGEKICKDER